MAVIDLDGFRSTNQELGYAAGDRLLHAAARRLETCLRRGDTLVRFGSDEFAILLADLQPADAGRVGDRLQAALGAPIFGLVIQFLGFGAMFLGSALAMTIGLVATLARWSALSRGRASAM